MSNDPLPEKTYLELIEKLYSPLKFGENSVLVCPPLYGRDHNVVNMLKRGEYKSTVLGNLNENFIYGDCYIENVVKDEPQVVWLKVLANSIGISNIRSFTRFKSEIEKILKKSKKEVVISVNISEMLEDNLFINFLELAQRIYYISSSKIHFLIIFDMKWSEEDFFKLTVPFRSLFQNVRFLSEYSDEEIDYFVKFLTKKWKFKVDEQMRSHIVKQSGGIMLLAKAAMRVAVSEDYSNLNELENNLHIHEDFILQIKFFLYRLSDRHRQILYDISNKIENHEKLEIKAMYNMGLLKMNLSKPSIRALAIRDYLIEETKSIHYITNAIVDAEGFSKREKALLLKLIDHSERVVTRDEIAEILWADDKLEKYSEWAIDQTISRIKKKLITTTELENIEIITRKKYGYQLNIR